MKWQRFCSISRKLWPDDLFLPKTPSALILPDFRPELGDPGQSKLCGS